MIKSRICEILGIKYPVFQGGMAWVADASLAAAVSNAGGLGLISSINAGTEAVRNEIRKCKELTDKPFGVNIMLQAPNAGEIAKMVVEEGVKILTTGAGSPAQYMEDWKAAGIKVIPVVASVALALKMQAISYVPGIETRDITKIFKGTPMGTRYGLAKADQNCFLEDEYLLHFAPLILQNRQSLPVTLYNSLPIPCTVDIAVNSRNKLTKPIFPFDTSEKVVELEPNGSKTINVSFVPVTCDHFTADFEATVKGGTDDGTRLLHIPIEGTGTLPVISLVSDLEKGKSSVYSVNLGRTLVGFTREKMVTIRNDGVIDARLSINCKTVPDFQLTGFNQPVAEYRLEPGRLLNLPIVFAPQKPRSSKFDITVNVLENPKATLGFSFVGEGYFEDVILEGLQEDDIDIWFKNAVVGRQQDWTFRMRNLSQSNIRFAWPVHPELTFSPRVGHLHVGQIKPVTVTFFTEKPMKMNGAKINCQWSKIDYSDPDAPDWDDSMKVVKYVPKSSLQPVEEIQTRRSTASRSSMRKSGPVQIKKAEKPQPQIQDGPGDTVKVTEVKPEPEYTQQPGKYKDLQLKISAVSDWIKYTLDTDTINFSPTMMYQSRVYEVKMTNPSAIRFNYKWRVSKFESIRTNYAKTRHSPFTVEPSSGAIEPGQATVFRVRFAPEEVDEFSAELKCEIPFLHSSDPPVINVTAFSRRPLCHFSVDTSDYISAGKRHPDYKYELPSDIKVVEIFANAVGHKGHKRFEIINPTSSPYEITWTKKTPEENAIVCETPCALVSSGRRYTMCFSFTPTSVKPVECLWEFKIPEHQTSMTFLTVGRIVPK